MPCVVWDNEGFPSSFLWYKVEKLCILCLLFHKNASTLPQQMAQLGEEQRAIHRGWQEKGDWLRQCMDLQLFNREADQIDAATSSHETFLEYKDLGVSFV